MILIHSHQMAVVTLSLDKSEEREVSAPDYTNSPVTHAFKARLLNSCCVTAFRLGVFVCSERILTIQKCIQKCNGMLPGGAGWRGKEVAER